MPPIYYLNPPPNPFWDFVAGLEDHPFFRGPPPPPRPTSTSGPAQAPPQPEPEMSEKAQGKQPTVEDPPEVDPSTVKPERKGSEFPPRDRAFPFRGRGRFAEAFNENGNEDNDTSGYGNPREGRRCRRGGRHHGPGAGPGSNGPPPFMFGHPFFARPPWVQPGFQGPPGPPGPPGSHGHHGPPHEHRHRPGPPPHAHPHHHEHHRRGPPTDIRDRDRRFGHGPPHRRCSPPHERAPFDLSEFLNNLGSKLGIDLTNAAEGLGLVQDRFTAGRTSSEVNFEPRADIFENQSAYTVHLSLPGAKKEDVGVEYEGDHSVLRITGVVHRPDVDEQMMNELVVDGRKRETGVFEKAIRLGTKRDPANIDVAGITAKMTDGVLVVRIPKVPQTQHKRGVEIETEPDTSFNTAARQQQPDYENDYSEKPVLFDAEDDHASEAAAEPSKREEISLIDMKDNDITSSSVVAAEQKKKKTKAQEAEEEEEEEEGKNKNKAATVADEGEVEEEEDEEEQLPVYTVQGQAQADEDDWERFSDDSGEGEYIKIDVK